MYDHPVHVLEPVPYTLEFSVTPEAPVVHRLISGSRFLLTATPGTGGSVLVETRDSDNDEWLSWPYGAVTEVTIRRCAGPVAQLRFTATTAPGRVTLVQ